VKIPPWAESPLPFIPAIPFAISFYLKSNTLEIIEEQ